MEQNQNDELRHKTFLRSIFLFMMLLSVNFLSWQLGRVAVNKNTRVNFDNHVHYIKMAVEERLNEFVDDLNHSRSWFEAINTFGRKEFAQITLADKHEAEYNQEGTLFVQRVKLADRDKFVAGVRADKALSPFGYPFFNIHVADQKEEYYIVNYAVPYEKFKNIFGNDIGLDPDLLVYFEKARQTGQVVTTPDIQFFNSSRMLMIQPVFSSSSLNYSAYDNLNGFLVTVLKADTLFDGLLDSDHEGITYSIYDGQVKGNTPFYLDSNEKNRTEQKSELFTNTETVAYGDRTWTIQFSSDPDNNDLERRLPDILFVISTVLSLAVFAVLSLAIYPPDPLPAKQ